MKTAFSEMVHRVLGNFLSSNGFLRVAAPTLEHARKEVVLYESPVCRLVIYRSAIDGEVNCKVGVPGADFALFDKGPGWFFLMSLVHQGAGPSIEELLARLPNTPRSSAEQLQSVAVNLESHFAKVVASLPGK